jgi:hypothetical protein
LRRCRRSWLAGWLIQIRGILTENNESLIRLGEDREHPQFVQALHSGALIAMMPETI